MSDWRTHRESVMGAIEERRQKVATLTQKGSSLREIAETLGVTMRTVERDREALKITQPRPRPFTMDEQRRARAMLDDGCSLAEVARTLGRNYETIQRRYRWQGWTPQRTGQYNALRELRQQVLDD